jgi:Protein of unknown function (DUF4242)
MPTAQASSYRRSDNVDSREWMETYVIQRRGGWRTADELLAAVARSEAELEWAPDDLLWIRSYVLTETDGTLGTVCVYEATSPEAIRAHASRAGLPVDEIVKVTDTLVLRPDSVSTAP